MYHYLVRRLGRSVLALWGISTIVFGVMRLSGDPAVLLLPQEASREDVQRLRHDLGLDEPLLVQYGRFLGHAVIGNFGESLRHKEPAMHDVIRLDYITTARAKGLREGWVIWRHALKNAAIPVVTIMGLQFGTLLGGAVVTETVFSWPGIGRLAIQGIYNRDYPVVQAAVFTAAVFFVGINFVVDLLYTFLDPRIRYE